MLDMNATLSKPNPVVPDEVTYISTYLPGCACLCAAPSCARVRPCAWHAFFMLSGMHFSGTNIPAVRRLCVCICICICVHVPAGASACALDKDSTSQLAYMYAASNVVKVVVSAASALASASVCVTVQLCGCCALDHASSSCAALCGRPYKRAAGSTSTSRGL
jgi:hypothetical protein